MSRPPHPYNGYRNASGSFSQGQGAASSMTGSSTRLNPPQFMNQRPHSPSSTPAPSSTSPASPNLSNMSRAERFDDEKRRIVESCFSKLDQNGQLAESYITHIRVQEDAAYPSVPPPPESPAENRKPRVIIIAVRSTGRVRMHKARENNNGSFSIGKTWNLEELTAIESFSSCPTPPQNEREAQYRQWAGAVGFTVTITKPYYWQAGTSKEKDFFIASAVKIYRKYTKGQVPELKGFDEKERSAILGAPMPPGSSQQQQQQQLPPPQGPRAPSATARPQLSNPSQTSFGGREQARDESRYRESPGPPGSSAGDRAPPENPARFGSPNLSSAGVPTSGSPSTNDPSMRMRSYENLQAQQPYRPGTASGPRPMPTSREPSFNPRSPQPQENNGISPPPRRDGTFPGPTVTPTSPKRQRDARIIGDSPLNGRQPEQVLGSNGGVPANGQQPQLTARDRWAKQGQAQGTDGGYPSQSSETSSRNGTLMSAPDLIPENTARSSPSHDIGDAAALSAVASYWNNTEQPPAIPNRTPQVNDSVSPPTPERSKRRPRVELNPSKSTLDLRPAPLSQARKPTEENIEHRAPELSRQVSGQGNGLSSHHQDEIRPLNVQNKSEVQTAKVDADRSGAPVVSTPEAPTAATSTPAEEVAGPNESEEQFRPGLGPMIRKKAVADRFKKAATAANAFKPRPGGAAEKILRQQAERNAGPDGITGVVPRPALPAQEPSSETVSTPPAEETLPKVLQRNTPPSVEVLAATPAHEMPPVVSAQGSAQESDVAHLNPVPYRSPAPSEIATSAEEKIEQRHARQHQVKIKRRSAFQEKNLSALQIDRKLVEGQGIEFEVMLTDFGWSKNILKTQQLVEFERDIRRELGRVEAGSWLSQADVAREEKVNHVESLIDKAIEECDELEGLLTLYNVELSSLNDDIAFIEAQSQGLQVQSANQKLLHSELRNLVDTMSLDRRTMEPLQYADLSDLNALVDVEKSLVKLYRAMLTIDPALHSNSAGRPSSRGVLGESETANMAALREKKDVYGRECAKFSQRLVDTLDTKFTLSFNAAQPRILRIPPRGGFAKLDENAFNDARSEMWTYAPLILFMRDLDRSAWSKALQIYQSRAKPVYTDSFRENLSNWRRAARSPTGDEQELLFTHQEKEDLPNSGGITSTARRITVKRSHTLAKTFRNASGDKQTAAEHRQAGAMIRAAAFGRALDEMAPLIRNEQNFVVELFHASSLDTTDFVDAVQAAPPTMRRSPNFQDNKPTDPDRAMAATVTTTINDIFATFAQELSAMLDWAVSDDPLQGVGVMASLSSHAYFLQDSSQEFLLELINNLFTRLQTRFGKFVEEQIRAIEDTKVKIKKRKGVITFMKVFPHFSAAVENIFSIVAGIHYDRARDPVAEVRKLVDEAYDRINRAMFESLKTIATEGPAAATLNPLQPARVGDEAEDKEMLNYRVLIIENMNHYVEEVDEGQRDGVLAQWKARALMDRAEALEEYVSKVIRRPLGKILEFLESVDSIQASAPNNPGLATSRPSYNRKAMRHLMSLHDAKEIRRGIDTLRKRIEKHFGEGDEEAISRSLIGLVCKECERSYERVLDRIEKLVREAYPPTDGEKPVEIDFTRADIQAGFRR